MAGRQCQRIKDRTVDRSSRHKRRRYHPHDSRRRRLGADMIALGNVTIGALIVVALVVVILLATLRRMVNIVQQGEVGVVKRLGEYPRPTAPGLVTSGPLTAPLKRVEMREIPV